MSEADYIVLIADRLPIEQAWGLLRWWYDGEIAQGRIMRGDPHLEWWIYRHAAEIVPVLAKGRF